MIHQLSKPNLQSRRSKSEFRMLIHFGRSKVFVGTAEDVRLHITLREVIVQMHSYSGSREIY